MIDDDHGKWWRWFWQWQWWWRDVLCDDVYYSLYRSLFFLSLILLVITAVPFPHAQKIHIRIFSFLILYCFILSLSHICLPILCIDMKLNNKSNNFFCHSLSFIQQIYLLRPFFHRNFKILCFRIIRNFFEWYIKRGK